MTTLTCVLKCRSTFGLRVIGRLMLSSWFVLPVGQTRALGAETDTPTVRLEQTTSTNHSLADASEARRFDDLARLLSLGADANASQVDGMTALHWSVHYEHVASTKLMIDAGADPNQKNRLGVAPLVLACVSGNQQIVELLLRAGANPNTAQRGGETVLMTAARTGRVGPVKSLLSAGAIVDAKERRNQTAIMWASAEGHADVVQTLLDANAEFRTPLESGFTPLFFAVREGHAEVVRRLIAAGDDVNGTMQPEKSGNKWPRSGMSPLLLAVENGHFELALQLLKDGADPNDQRSGYTALHTVTWVRKPNRGDDADGDPAPIGSGRVDSLEFVRRIVELGADVNLQLERGRSGRGRLNLTGATVFLMAAKTGDIPLMRLLLELGADPTLPNADHCTPLMAAAGIGTLAPTEEAGTEEEALTAVDLLLQLGMDVNHVDDNGETAMHGAAYKSFPQVVQLLDQRGADLLIWNRPNKYGWTPQMIAEGHRPGNFKPSTETLAAIHQLFEAHHLPVPEPTPREARKGYQTP